MNRFLSVFAMIFVSATMIFGMAACEAEPPTGACCLSNGVCVTGTNKACSEQGGTYLGDNKACTPNPCPQPNLMTQMGSGKLFFGGNNNMRLLFGIIGVAGLLFLWKGNKLQPSASTTNKIIAGVCAVALLAALTGCEESQNNKQTRANVQQRATQLKLEEKKVIGTRPEGWAALYQMPINFGAAVWEQAVYVRGAEGQYNPENGTVFYPTTATMSKKNTEKNTHAPAITGIMITTKNDFFTVLGISTPQTVATVWARNPNDQSGEFILHDSLAVKASKLVDDGIYIECFPVSGGKPTDDWRFHGPIRGPLSTTNMVSK